MTRFLFGPEPLPAQRFPDASGRGEGVAFTAGPLLGAASWEAFAAAVSPAGFAADLLVLDLSYQVLPSWLSTVPLPVVGLAGDASLLWHSYKHLAGIDLLLCDTASAERFRQQGRTPARAANLYGAEQIFFNDAGDGDRERDIDVLFVGNLHPAVQAERLPWLQRLARFRERWNVQIITDAWGADYRALLSRSRIVFNRSARSEWNRRSSEALIAGALLLTERDNREVPTLLRDRVECVFYDDGNLESLLEYYLTHEDERLAVAKAGQARAREFSFEAQWRKTLAMIEGELPVLGERARSRPAVDPIPAIVSRVWRAASAHQSQDASLLDDLWQALEREPKNAELHNALGIAVALATRDGGRITVSCAANAARHFRDAVVHDSRHLVAALNLVEALLGVEQQALAVETARRALVTLDREASSAPSWLDAPHFPPTLDLFTVQWQKAGWDHAGNPASEARAKRDLLCWRFHTLLATLTGDLAHYHEAVSARPDLSSSRAALGCALARDKRVDLAVPHLRAAVAGNPFDGEAARALYQACLDTADGDGAGALARDQGLLRLSAPAVVPPESWHLRPIPPASTGELQVESLTPEDFAGRYWRVDTARALHAFTPPHDASVVLSLLAGLKPGRILEIGTAAGHMTANLTEWSPDEATVFTIGTTADMAGTCAPEQQREAPPPEVIGGCAGHFGKLDKVQFIRADSSRYNFARLAPLDFAFIDGAHDLEHVLADTRNVYAALRPGGCMAWHDFGSKTPWVQVREAIEQARLPEPIHHVAGTEVAFLFKGTSDECRGTNEEKSITGQRSPVPASAHATRHSPLTTLRWEGGVGGLHSLALVNRQLCQRLLRRDVELSILPVEMHPAVGVPELPLPSELRRCFRKELSREAEVHVRHRWPPDFRPPASGHFVVMQPWEYGALPRDWARPLQEWADEVWVPTHHVRDCFVEGGIPAERVAVVPLGVDTALYHPEVPPLVLKTRKRFKFLFVGGTIWRKGIDVLLETYQRAFTASDDVCLVIKDMGTGTYYRGQTAEEPIAAFRAQEGAAEIEYLDGLLSAEELAGLYTACDCLVHPYRGEGFGLPIAEAMASGLPVVVTNRGAALDFCDPNNAYLIPATRVVQEQQRVGNQATVGQPWHAEPDREMLAALMRQVFDHPNEAKAKGKVACEHIRARFTWDHAADAVMKRVEELRKKPILRLQRRAPIHVPRPAPQTRRMRVSLTMIVKNEERNIADCLRGVHDLVDEIILVDTGSTDRTKEIIAGFGPKVKVFDFPWIDDFAAARNESLRHATGDYVLWLDADDRLDEPNRDRLRQLLASLTNDNDAYVLKCLCPPDDAGNTPTVVDHVRLFRNRHDHRWRYPIHEQILGSLRTTNARVRWADVTVLHVGYADPVLRAKKTQRDLRLLHKAHGANPDEPFVLFNLGMTYQDLGRHEEALDYLQRSLQRSDPRDSIVRKLYSLIASCHLSLGRREQALHATEEGLKVCPDDAELLFRQAQLLQSIGSLDRAEAALWALVRSKSDPHFASTDPSLRGWRGRNELAAVLFRQRRHEEARAQWRLIVQEHPACFPAWLGLADVAIALGEAATLEEVARQIDRFEGGGVQADLVRCRMLLGRRELDKVKALAGHMIARDPRQLGPRVIMARTLSIEGQDLRQSEQAWRQVLLLDPCHAEAQGVLSDLIRQRVLNQDGYFQARSDLTGWVLGERYQAACMTPSELHEHLPTLYDLARECTHVTDVGTGQGLAALAFLWAQPDKLVCIDVARSDEIDRLQALKGRTELVFRKAEVLTLELEETDLLFLDTRHDAGQLKGELDRHSAKSRKYLVLHGTTRYVDKGESETGIGPVVEEFLTHGTFRLKQRYENNEGLTVLVRVSSEE